MPVAAGGGPLKIDGDGGISLEALLLTFQKKFFLWL
jgi:hypothetical protein